VAVVAGGVHRPLLHALDWLGERLPGVPVVYVPGNHDFWWDHGEERYTIHDQITRGRDRAAALGIALLMDVAVALGDTRYLRGTLWTDFRLGTFSLTHGFRSAQSREGIVDYRRIRTGLSSRHRIDPEEVLAMRRTTRAFLDAGLAKGYDGPTVVVTHHVAHPDSPLPPHAHLACCDASDLSPTIDGHGPDLWVHGHAHRHSDHCVGRTRIVCNAHGHVDENLGFRHGITVALPARGFDQRE
jgi:DNA repair exonuclease SbcCD nuclease subunit